MVGRLKDLQRRVADREVSCLGVPPGLLIGLAQEVEKNFATPLYSSGLWPFSTQRLAPPMIELPWGYPANRGGSPVPHSNLAVLARVPNEGGGGQADSRLAIDD